MRRSPAAFRAVNSCRPPLRTSGVFFFFLRGIGSQPAAKFAVCGSGVEPLAFGIERGAIHGALVAAERLFDAAIGGVEDARGAVAAGAGEADPIGTEGQRHDPIRM